MIPAISFHSLVGISPLLGLIGLAALALILEVVFKERGRVVNGILILSGVVGIFLGVLSAAWGANGVQTEPFFGSLLFDSYALFFSGIFLVATFLAICLQIADAEVRCGETYCLTLLSAVGMMLMAAGLDLITIILGLEVMSIGVYALAGVRRTDLLSNEASLKYFLLGAFASGFFLYGIALCYGATGSVYIESIASAVVDAKTTSPLLTAGLVLMITGLAFKVALVPFHMWAPDVYEGAPASVTAFMATAVKAAGFAAFLRILLAAFPESYAHWSKILAVLAVLTMTLGNIVALSQRTLKRMLAYSSIAHAGYILLGLVACKSGNETGGVSSVLYYLLSYTFMTAGAFAIVSYMDCFSEGEDRRRYAGLGWKRPFLAASLAIFLLSLAGIPPTAGFVAKFFVFSATLQAGYVSLAVIAILNSLVSLYYYLRPIVWMYMEEGSEESPTLPVPVLLTVVLIIAVVGTLSVGLMPGSQSRLAIEAANSILSVTPLTAGTH